MDYNVVSTENHINDEIARAEEACYNAALEAGKTQEQAENCDDGDCGCPECPWRK